MVKTFMQTILFWSLALPATCIFRSELDLPLEPDSAKALKSDSADKATQTHTQPKELSPEAHNFVGDALVKKKIAKLQSEGSKGRLKFSKKSKASEAHDSYLAGVLTYEGMELTFDIHKGGSLLTEASGVVIFGNERKSGTVEALTFEGETFVQEIQNNTVGALLYLGKHEDHFHSSTAESVSESLLSAGSDQLETSAKLYRAALEKLFSDKYDNAVVEMFTGFFAEGISAASHECLFNVFGIYEEIQANSVVITEDTMTEMKKLTVTEDEVVAASEEIAAESSLKTNDMEQALLKKGPRRRRRYRCWYTLCGNTRFGQCGNAENGGWETPICFNTDCNWGCEWHDEICASAHEPCKTHRPRGTGYSDGWCKPTLAGLLADPWACSECSDGRAKCR